MNIELSKTTEKAIREVLATGKFSTAQAFLEAAAQAYASAVTARQVEEYEGTAFERFEQLGVIGCCEGPPDLSTNPKHMDGFGQ